MLVLSVPELRRSSQNHIIGAIDLVAELSAKRLGRDPNDPAVRNASGALFGVMLSVMLDWVKNPEMDVVSTMDKRVAHLEAGLPL